MTKFRHPPRITRSDVVRAFSAPQLSHNQTMALVKRFMGDSPVPPAWSYAGVRGSLGRHAARLWARHLRHRPAGAYRHAETGRWLHPIVQTCYDFGTTPEVMREFQMSTINWPGAPASRPPELKRSFACLDEYHRT